MEPHDVIPSTHLEIRSRGISHLLLAACTNEGPLSVVLVQVVGLSLDDADLLLGGRGILILSSNLLDCGDGDNVACRN